MLHWAAREVSKSIYATDTSICVLHFSASSAKQGHMQVWEDSDSDWTKSTKMLKQWQVDGKLFVDATCENVYNLMFFSLPLKYYVTETNYSLIALFKCGWGSMLL